MINVKHEEANELLAATSNDVSNFIAQAQNEQMANADIIEQIVSNDEYVGNVGVAMTGDANVCMAAIECIGTKLGLPIITIDETLDVDNGSAFGRWVYSTKEKTFKWVTSELGRVVKDGGIVVVRNLKQFDYEQFAVIQCLLRKYALGATEDGYGVKTHDNIKLFILDAGDLNLAALGEYVPYARF